LKQAIAALGVLVLVLVASNAWTLRSNVALRAEVQDKEGKIQRMVAATKAQKAQSSAGTGRLAKSRAARLEVARRKKANPRLQSDTQKQAARDRMRDSALVDRMDAVVDLADEREWPDDLTSEVIAIFEETNGLMTAVRDDVGNGILSPEDGRDEMGAIRDEVGEVLSDILGREEYEIFRARVWGGSR
jgi:hypothetical protein